MYRLYIILLIVFFTSDLTAQHTLVKQWDKRFGGTSIDWLYTIIQTKDGGFLLGGWSKSDANGDKTQPNWDTSLVTADYWIVKVDSIGNKQWDQRYGGTDDDILSTLQQTSDGGYLLSGTSFSGASGNKTQPSWGAADYWIVKTDSMGNQQWDKRFGGTNDDVLIAARQTFDKGYILGGSSDSPISGDKTQDDWDATLNTSDYWIVKVDSMGNKQWDKRYGGTGQEAFWTFDQTSDGGYILGGFSGSDISGDKTQANSGYDGDYNCWIVKIDSLGNQQWDKIVFHALDIYSLIQLDNGGYMMFGDADSGNDGYDTLATAGASLMQLDSLGNTGCVRTFPEAYVTYPNYSFAMTSDGGYLIGTYSYAGAGGDKSENNPSLNAQTWVIKTDSTGAKQWDKTIFTTGDDVTGYAIQCTDGNYLIANYTTAGIGYYKTQPNWDTTLNTDDYWIIKMNDTLLSGINQLTDSMVVSVYPNPFASDISISLQAPNIQNATFTISNILGETIFYKQESNLSNHYTKMLDLSYLANGVYLLEVIVDGKRMVQKVVKQ